MQHFTIERTNDVKTLVPFFYYFEIFLFVFIIYWDRESRYIE